MRHVELEPDKAGGRGQAATARNTEAVGPLLVYPHHVVWITNQVTGGCAMGLVDGSILVWDKATAQEVSAMLLKGLQ